MLENFEEDSRFDVVYRTCIPMYPSEPFPDKDVMEGLSDEEISELYSWAEDFVRSQIEKGLNI